MSRSRTCRIEAIEPRQMLSAVAPMLNIGATYYQPHDGNETIGSLLYISWNGGAPGTALTDILIDTHKVAGNTPQFTVATPADGDVLFNTGPTELSGTLGGIPLSILQWTGTTQPTITVSNDSTLMDIHFANGDFQPNGRLVIKVGFAIVQSWSGGEDTRVVEGADFDGTSFEAVLSAPHYQTDTVTGFFRNSYNNPTTLGLNLPDEDYDNASAIYTTGLPPSDPPEPVFTAGVLASAQQTPLPVTLSGEVYCAPNDVNQLEPGDPGIPGATLALYEQGSDGSYTATGATTVTDANGDYSFGNLLPGTYRVVETTPDGYLSLGDTPGTVGGQTRGQVESATALTAINLDGGDDSVQNDFSNVQPATISGYVYYDANDDGAMDAGDTGIANVEVVVKNTATGAQFDAYTTANGSWSVGGLMPGQYQATEVQPAGYLEGTTTAGTVNGTVVGTAQNPGAVIGGITLLGNQAGINYDFGELLPASVSGYVYVDAHNNGVFGPGDPPLADQQLTLLDSQGNTVGTTVTDSSGYYSFTGLLPGTYSVSLAQPAGYYEGVDTAGTIDGVQVGTAHDPGNLIDGVALGCDQAGINYNFGELLPATISGVVFVDNNGTGTLAANDTLLPNVTVYLLDASGNQLASTTTNASGQYAFTDLLPGTYGTQDVEPAGYLTGGDLVGSAGGTTSGPNEILGAQLGSGAAGTDYDFYVVPPATISGYVFQDGPPLVLAQDAAVPYIPSVRDGKLTASDPRLSGVVMQLCDATGYPLKNAQGNLITTTTDANGYYQFTNLSPGQYSVVETQPAGYTPGVDTAGSQGGLVVDSYSQLSASVLSTLAVSPDGAAIVKISIPPGTTAAQYNFAEVLIQRQPPTQPPVTPPVTPPIPSPPPVMPPFMPAYVASPFAAEQAVAVPYALVPPTVTQPIFGGGTTPEDYSWHLSVVDAGQPRSADSADELADVQSTDSTYFDPASWTGADMNQSEWTLADADGVPIVTYHFGVAGATPVTGDWNGSGTTKIGVFIDGLWFLDLNGNGSWDQGDLWLKLGHTGDQPVTGDWNGDGKTDIGIFGPAWVGDQRPIASEPGLPDAQNPPPTTRPKNVPPDPPDAALGHRTMKQGQHGRMRSDVIDHVFQYGGRGDIAVTGDWNGDGIYTIGIFHHGTWYLDMDGDGRWGPEDQVVQFGQDGDIPVVGDWTGDGITKLGVFRNGKFYLDVHNSHKLDAGDKVIELGGPGDKPVVGDWTGDGIDKVGVYHDGPVPAVPLQAKK
jgi:protocatechuate 3,4-dioxygenase beta subunit